MMPAKGKDLIVDLVERTKHNYKLVEKGPYGVTQLINSAVSLLIIPKESDFITVTDNFIDSELLSKLLACSESSYKKTLDLCQIVRHMRNAISHGRIEFAGEKLPQKNAPPEIRAVIFKDQDMHNPAKKFKIEMSVELLHEFFFKFSDSVSKTIRSI